jgi:hypothetical protein
MIPSIGSDLPDSEFAAGAIGYPSCPWPVPGIPVFASFDKKGVDGRDKSGHDELCHELTIREASTKKPPHCEGPSVISIFAIAI